jgi:hypothetical protein
MLVLYICCIWTGSVYTYDDTIAHVMASVHPVEEMTPQQINYASLLILDVPSVINWCSLLSNLATHPCMPWWGGGCLEGLVSQSYLMALLFHHRALQLTGGLHASLENRDEKWTHSLKCHALSSRCRHPTSQKWFLFCLTNRRSDLRKASRTPCVTGNRQSLVTARVALTCECIREVERKL